MLLIDDRPLTQRHRLAVEDDGQAAVVRLFRIDKGDRQRVRASLEAFDKQIVKGDGIAQQKPPRR